MSDQTETAFMTKTPGRAFTLRAVVIGLLLTVVVAVITPVNDWLLHNTYFYSQHLPVGIFLLVVVMGIVINPLLGRRRLASGELLVIIGMLLVLGGVVSSGLNRVFPAIIAGPAKIMSTSSELDAYVTEDGAVQLPHGPYIGMPAQGRPDANDPHYRYVVDGFHVGLGSDQPSVTDYAIVTWAGDDGVSHTATAGRTAGPGQLDLNSPLGKAMAGQKAGTQIAGPDGAIHIHTVKSPGVPWGLWTRALLAWAPVLIAAMVCFVSMAALVRKQWLHHERLPYPIANVLTAYVEEPRAGSRFAPIFCSRWFWVGFAIAAVVLLSQGLETLKLIPFSIPTNINLRQSFSGAPFSLGYAWWDYLNPTIFFSIVGIIFLIPAELSFSLWFCFVFGNIVYIVLSMQGVPVEASMVYKTAMGGWVVQAVLIIWIGRVYYWQLLRSAVMRSADPEIQDLRIFTWAFLAGAIGLVLAMVGYGAQLGHAIIAALCYLGIGLVLARLVAEAGIPFIQTPMGWSVQGLIYSLTGLSAPIAALVPLSMLGQTLCADPREHLLPFATNAEYLADRAGVKRVRWGAVVLVVLGVGTVVSGAVMLMCAYHGQGQQALDGWWRGGPLMSGLGPIATAAVDGDPIDAATTWACYGVGAVVTAGLGVARLLVSWWPIHPIGFLVAASYPTYRIWFSFFVAWLAKILIMRYGGVQLYKTLKPFALGLIAAEAIVAGGFLVAALIYGLCGGHFVAQPRFLPG